MQLRVASQLEKSAIRRNHFLVGSTWFLGYTNPLGYGNAYDRLGQLDESPGLDIRHGQVIFVDRRQRTGNEAVVAPQILRDTNGGIYMFAAGSATWLSNTGDEILYVQPTDLAGLTTWGTPQTLAVNGTGAFMPYDPFPVLVGGTYYLFYGSYDNVSTAHQSAVATASTITGIYTQQSLPLFLLHMNRLA